MSLEFASKLRAIPAYPKAEPYAFDGALAKLASNETPWPPHREVIAAIQRALPSLNRYPDPEGVVLRRRLAERHGVPLAKVALGNGSCEILLAAAEVLLEP